MHSHGKVGAYDQVCHQGQLGFSTICQLFFFFLFLQLLSATIYYVNVKAIIGLLENSPIEFLMCAQQLK